MKVEDSTFSFSSSAAATGRTPPHGVATREVNVAPDSTANPPRSTSARLHDAKGYLDEETALPVSPAFMIRTRRRRRHDDDAAVKACEGARKSASATSTTRMTAESQDRCSGGDDMLVWAVMVSWWSGGRMRAATWSMPELPLALCLLPLQRSPTLSLWPCAPEPVQEDKGDEHVGVSARVDTWKSNNGLQKGLYKSDASSTSSLPSRYAQHEKSKQAKAKA